MLLLAVLLTSEEGLATTYDGDLVVDDTDYTTLSSLTYVNGNVTVKDNGTLLIQDSTLQVNQTANHTRQFTISGNGKVIISGSTLKSDGKLDADVDDSVLNRSS